MIAEHRGEYASRRTSSSPAAARLTLDRPERGNAITRELIGFCVAGGTDVALCCDLLVIAADAKIGYPPACVWGSPTMALWVRERDEPFGAAGRSAFKG